MHNITTIWLFNIAMANHHAIKFGKPYMYIYIYIYTYIYIWAIYTMAMLNNQRVNTIILIGRWF